MSTQMDKLNGLSKPKNQVSYNTNYLQNGRMMLCSGIILFTAISIMFCFHSYARCIRRRSQPQSHLLSPSASVGVAASQGLDPCILKNLPTMVYSSKTQDPVPECAVCLSEFRDGEKGRILSKCNHTFHICCIDRWFQSHSNCPLCRAPVQSGTVTEICAETVVTVVEQGGLQHELRHCKDSSCSASYSPASLPHLECQRKSLDLVSILVEVPIATGDQRLRGLVDMGLSQSGLRGSNSKSPLDPLKS